MKQSEYINPSEETETGFPVNSKYGRTPSNKHGGVCRQQEESYWLKSARDHAHDFSRVIVTAHDIKA